MKKRRVLISILFIVSFFVNCYSVEVIDDTKGKSQGYSNGGNGWYPSFLLGLIESDSKMGTRAICPNGTKKVIMKQSFVNIIAHLGMNCLIGVGYPWIVAFNSNEYYCASSPMDKTKTEPKKKSKDADSSEFNRVIVLKDGTIITDLKIEEIDDSILTISKNGEKKIYKKEEIQNMK